jgi:acyl-CoA thioesterase I
MRSRATSVAAAVLFALGMCWTNRALAEEPKMNEGTGKNANRMLDPITTGTAAQKEGKMADKKTYLADVVAELKKEWPANRTVNIVCHGHSVPSGYFLTPAVHTLEAYPHLLHKGLCERFPLAVTNVIVTAIGGEAAESGAARFEKDVLTHNPDVITIDYSLNDRGLGLERARVAWVSMIEKAKAKGIKVILLTPTPDTTEDLFDPQAPVNQHAAQVRALAKEYGVGLADSHAAFEEYVRKGGKLEDTMSQFNHPNHKGHQLAATRLLEWFPQ